MSAVNGAREFVSAVNGARGCSQVKLAIIDYGIGNLRSAEKALQRVGADARLTSDPSDISAADGVVMPGVGNFGACMNALRRDGLDEIVHAVVASGVPFLGICVGMQMLFDTSVESPDVPGLGIINGTVELLPDTVKRPQMQWNQLHWGANSALAQGLEAEPWVYLVHSYYCVPSDSTTIIATCDYGVDVACVVQQRNVTATQFHPEKSGTMGLAILANWTQSVKVA